MILYQINLYLFTTLFDKDAKYPDAQTLRRSDISAISGPESYNLNAISVQTKEFLYNQGSLL